MSGNERTVIEGGTTGDDGLGLLWEMTGNPGQVYEGDMNTTENPLHNKCHFLIDGRLHGAHEGQAGVGLEGGSGCCITMLHHNMEPGCRREASPDMSRITGHAIVLRRFLVGCRTSDIDFWPPGVSGTRQLACPVRP